MHLKLLFKQSFRDFTNKIILYLTFTLFLVLAVSVSLGMVAFAYGFKSGFDESLGSARTNASFQNNYRFLPATIDETEPGAEAFSLQEETEPGTENGYFYNFLARISPDLTDEEGKPLIESDDDLAALLLGVGYQRGSLWTLGIQQLTENDLLAQYFGTYPLTKFNQNVVYLRHLIMEKYLTNNFATAYFIDQVQSPRKSEFVLAKERMWNKNLEMVDHPDQIIYWEYLQTETRMGEIHRSTPELLHTNATNTQKIWSEVDWTRPEYQTYWQNQQLVYVQPSFLHQFNFKIGDLLKVRLTTWDEQSQPADPVPLLIAGTLTYRQNLSVGLGPTLLVPYTFMKNQYDLWNSSNHLTVFSKFDYQQVFSPKVFLHVRAKNGDLIGGQEVGSRWFNQVYSNLKNPGVALFTGVEWAKFYPDYSYEFTETVFLIIASVIGFVVLALLFIVFYFITEQIVLLQKKTLFFLKAMGVRDSGLSLLTTFAMLVPIIIGMTLGFFGSLWIQQIMYTIAYENLAFYMVYFSFNLAYWLALFGIVIFIALAFYFINIILIKSKNLTLEGMSQIKTNARLFEKVKVHLKKAPAQLRIGLSFAFKNIYKNLISYSILSITFAIILFGTQFNSSLDVSAHAYERWNQPYKSVYYQENLNLFSPTREGTTLDEDEYIREYETVSTLEGKIVVENDGDFYQLLVAYKQSLDNPNLYFNWKEHYLSESYLKAKLDLIANNPEAYEQFLQELIQRIEEIWDPDPVEKETILRLIYLVDGLVEKYREARRDYHYQGGFTLLFGQVWAPPVNRSILALPSYFLKKDVRTQTLAFEKNDWDGRNYFGFSHVQNDDDFLIEGSYIETNPVTNEQVVKKGKLLRVNVSSYLQSIQNLHRGDVIDLQITGLKSAQNPQKSVVHAYVDQIVKGDTIRPTIFTSQVGLVAYVLENLDFVSPQSLPDDQSVLKQKAAYEKLLRSLKEQGTTISNTIFDPEEMIPFGIRYLTLPIFHQTNRGSEPENPDPTLIGTRIEDFYDKEELEKYFQSINVSKVMVFNEVTKKLLKTAAPFTEVLSKFTYILLVISLAVSSILVTLVLLENREVILSFKAMGYKKSEVNWYLISGYFLSAILAVITAAVLALIFLNAAKGVIAEYLSTAVGFVWSWQFILFAFGLAAGFCLLISLSIIVYTNLQKPRNAFVTL